MTFLVTHSGQRVDLDPPKPEQIQIADIAWALSQQVRFVGHVDRAYTVAQHSVHVAELATKVDPSLGLAGLLHDAEEAYLGDWSSPLKKVFRERGCGLPFQLADQFKSAIGARFGVELLDESPIVKQADDRMYVTERRDLRSALAGQRSWSRDNYPDPVPEPIYVWSQSVAYQVFLACFRRCGGVA